MRIKLIVYCSATFISTVWKRPTDSDCYTFVNLDDQLNIILKKINTKKIFLHIAAIHKESRVWMKCQKKA